MTKRRNMFPIMQIWICIERHFKSNVKRSKQQRVPSLSSSGQKYFVSTCSVVHYNKITISIMLILAVCVVSTSSVCQSFIQQVFFPTSCPPPQLAFPFSMTFQWGWCLFFFTWGSWLGYRVVQVKGALFSLGTGYKKKKPLDSPGIQPPSSNMVVKGLLMLLF